MEVVMLDTERSEEETGGWVYLSTIIFGVIPEFCHCEFI